MAEAQLRNVHTETCGCGARVLVGMSDDWCASVVRTDVYPLGPFGEMLARLQVRGSYDLRREGERWRFYIRDHWHIRGRPAGQVAPTWRADVVADHWCNWPLPSGPSVYDLDRLSRPDPNLAPPF
jgi:hypothetical protein